MKIFRSRKWLAAISAAMMLVLFSIAGVSAQADDATVEEVTEDTVVETVSEATADPGVLIVSVLPDSPAAAAGLARGDIILAANGEELADVEALFQLVQDAAPGDNLELTIRHGDEERELSLTLGDNEGSAYIGIRPYLETVEVRAIRHTVAPSAVPHTEGIIGGMAAPGQDVRAVVVYMPMPAVSPFVPYSMPFPGMGWGMQSYPYGTMPHAPGYVVWQGMDPSTIHSGTGDVRFKVIESEAFEEETGNSVSPEVVTSSSMGSYAAPYFEIVPHGIYQQDVYEQDVQESATESTVEIRDSL